MYQVVGFAGNASSINWSPPARGRKLLGLASPFRNSMTRLQRTAPVSPQTKTSKYRLKTPCRGARRSRARLCPQRNTKKATPSCFRLNGGDNAGVVAAATWPHTMKAMPAAFIQSWNDSRLVFMTGMLRGFGCDAADETSRIARDHHPVRHSGRDHGAGGDQPAAAPLGHQHRS